VVITPASGFVQPRAAVLMGIIGSSICFAAMWVKGRFIHSARLVALGEKVETKSYLCKVTWMDDSLDAFGCHGLGGSLGALMTGLFATTEVNPSGSNGAFYGNPMQFVIQLVGVLATGAWSAIVTSIIFIVLKHTIGLRASPDQEEQGMDKTQHGEEGYFSVFRIDEERFLRFLSVPEFYLGFESFLKAEFSTENLYFVVAIESFKKLIIESSGSPDKIVAAGQVIYKDYCKDDSMLSVNISGHRRSQLKTFFDRKQWEDDQNGIDIMLELLEEAQEEICNLMMRDTFVRFKKTEQFKTFHENHQAMFTGQELNEVYK